jgi:hypothetical protein
VQLGYRQDTKLENHHGSPAATGVEAALRSAEGDQTSDKRRHPNGELRGMHAKTRLIAERLTLLLRDSAFRQDPLEATPGIEPG